VRRIHEIAEAKPDLLRFLEKNGIVPNARAEVAEVLPFNQTVSLKICDREVALGFAIAQYIFVERAD